MYLKALLSCSILLTTFHPLNSEKLSNFTYRSNHNEIKPESISNRKSNQPRNNIVEKPLRVGSFNVQTLSAKKLKNPSVMSTVEKIILRYDLTLIVEIMLSHNDRYNMEKLLTVINRLATDGAVYNMTLSPKLSESTTELCGFFYRSDKLSVMRSEIYQNTDNSFYRQPYMVQFMSSTLRDMTTFVAVGHHVKPTQAPQELSALADVYDYIKRKYQIPNVLIMGDFNADCAYVKEDDWKYISLWTREEFTWPIKTHVDTTTNYKSCALDRFVYAGENMNDGIIMTSASVFNFQEAFGLSSEETKKVSDHWPIEIEIRGKLSRTAEKHLSTSMCFTMDDSRTSNFTSSWGLPSKAKTAGFSILSTNLPDVVILQNETANERTMVHSLKNLRKFFPEIVTEEQLQGALYKIEQGSLEDDSSNADVPNLTFRIVAEHKRMLTSISICKASTVN